MHSPTPTNRRIANDCGVADENGNLERSEDGEKTESVTMEVKNTFLDTGSVMPQSLVGFFQERETKSCPQSLIGAPPGLPTTYESEPTPTPPRPTGEQGLAAAASSAFGSPMTPAALLPLTPAGNPRTPAVEFPQTPGPDEFYDYQYPAQPVIPLHKVADLPHPQQIQFSFAGAPAQAGLADEAPRPARVTEDEEARQLARIAESLKAENAALRSRAPMPPQVPEEDQAGRLAPIAESLQVDEAFRVAMKSSAVSAATTPPRAPPVALNLSLSLDQAPVAPVDPAPLLIAGAASSHPPAMAPPMYSADAMSMMMPMMNFSGCMMPPLAWPGAGMPAPTYPSFGMPSPMLPSPGVQFPGLPGAALPSGGVPLEAQPSVGSVGHSSGTCKPCVHFHKKGCRNGQNCEFCHVCGPGEVKRRQVERRRQSGTKTSK